MSFLEIPETYLQSGPRYLYEDYSYESDFEIKKAFFMPKANLCTITSVLILSPNKKQQKCLVKTDFLPLISNSHFNTLVFESQ